MGGQRRKVEQTYYGKMEPWGLGPLNAWPAKPAHLLRHTLRVSPKCRLPTLLSPLSGQGEGQGPTGHLELEAPFLFLRAEHQELTF